jgi:hypothetical protein
MSVTCCNYVIIGYDLSKDRDKLYTEDWVRNEDNINNWEYNQIKGEIQLFSDPMSGCYLYFGYIVAANDEYEDETVKISISDMERQKRYVDHKLKQTGLHLSNEIYPFEIISFVEYR